MIRELQAAGYRVCTTLDESLAASAVACLAAGAYRTGGVLKDNEHNFVARVALEGLPEAIYKIPRRRNQRRWERFLTLFRPGEAWRLFHSHIALEALGLACPHPLLAAERRRVGMVTDSFLLYQYTEGRPAQAGDAAAIARSLQILHRAGYTRGDPKAGNFLVAGDQVIFIDFRLARPRLLRRFNCHMEFAHLLHTLPEAEAYLPVHERESLSFRLARRLRAALSRGKAWKRRLRGR